MSRVPKSVILALLAFGAVLARIQVHVVLAWAAAALAIGTLPDHFRRS